MGVTGLAFVNTGLSDSQRSRANRESRGQPRDTPPCPRRQQLSPEAAVAEPRTSFITSRAASKETLASLGCCVDDGWRSSPKRGSPTSPKSLLPAIRSSTGRDFQFAVHSGSPFLCPAATVALARRSHNSDALRRRAFGPRGQICSRSKHRCRQLQPVPCFVSHRGGALRNADCCSGAIIRCSRRANSIVIPLIFHCSEKRRSACKPLKLLDRMRAVAPRFVRIRC
jgi:hypothetical protein